MQQQLFDTLLKMMEKDFEGSRRMPNLNDFAQPDFKAELEPDNCKFVGKADSRDPDSFHSTWITMLPEYLQPPQGCDLSIENPDEGKTTIPWLRFRLPP